MDAAGAVFSHLNPVDAAGADPDDVAGLLCEALDGNVPLPQLLQRRPPRALAEGEGELCDWN